MPRDIFTDSQVEAEIERLKRSPHVRLAEKEQRLKTKQRKYFYQLRWMEKRGKELEAMGMTLENMERLMAEIPDSEE